MIVTQVLCASLLLALGLGGIAFGIRALSGETRLPVPFFIRRAPGPLPPPRSQEILLTVAICFVVGMIALVGGIGLLLITLI